MTTKLLGVPAEQAVGQAVWMQYLALPGIVIEVPAPDVARIKFYDTTRRETATMRVNVRERDGTSPDSCGPFYFLTTPNPMDRAPRCGQSVRLIYNLGEIVAVWKPRSDGRFYAWKVGASQWATNERQFTGWLPCYGVDYDPAKMGAG